MPKRRRPSGRQRWQQKHLYSIRQVDLSSNSDPGDLLRCRRCTGRRDRLPHRRGERRLPPPIFHLEAPRDLPSYYAPFAAALGSKIMSMHPKQNPDRLYVDQPVTPNPVSVFDVRTRALSFARRPETAAPSGPWPMYIPVGNDRLFALSRDSFHLLISPPPAAEPPGDGGKAWRALPALPSGAHLDGYSSYAVHPDGRTIFVSVELITNSATFSFRIPEDEEGLAGGGWKPRGTWALPMNGSQGPAHLDPELNAWVGMSRSDESYGHICACDVVPADPDGGGDAQPPAWKLSKEKVIDEDDPAESTTGATLVYVGAKSRYCLLEYVLYRYDAAKRNGFYSDADLL